MWLTQVLNGLGHLERPLHVLVSRECHRRSSEVAWSETHTDSCTTLEATGLFCGTR